METEMNKIKEAADYLNKQGLNEPKVGIILGTGLGGLADVIEAPQEVNYGQIPHFPVSTVQSHKGALIFGKIGTTDVVAMAGRFHYYEGYSMKEVTFPIRVMKLLGVKTLIISNASGSTNPGFETGDLVVIKDHINLHHENPLRGENLEEFGPRFPDLESAYDDDLIELAHQEASLLGMELKEAVYTGVPGPNLETPAEFNYFRIIGGDIVGMSTVPEVIVANHMSLPVLAFSIVTNEGWTLEREKASVDEIIEVAQKQSVKLETLVKGVLKLMALK